MTTKNLAGHTLQKPPSAYEVNVAERRKLLCNRKIIPEMPSVSVHSVVLASGMCRVVFTTFVLHLDTFVLHVVWPLRIDTT